MKYRFLAALASSLTLAAASAGATVTLLKFTYSEPGTDTTVVWYQPANPTPVTSDSDDTEIDITGLTVDGSLVGSGDGIVEYFVGTLSPPGGFLISAAGVDAVDVQIFGGSTGSPTFGPTGVGFPIDLTDLLASDAAGTLTITAAPEPASWALMLAGFAGLGAALRSRRRTAAA